MSELLVLNLMRVAHQVTKAERAFAVNNRLDLLGTLEIAPEEIEASYLKCVKGSLETGQPILTDNYTMTLDPSKAPITNQSFPKLRAVVVIPVGDFGAVCLDQGLSQGIIAKTKIDRLNEVAVQMVSSGKLDATEDDILELFQQRA